MAATAAALPTAELSPAKLAIAPNPAAAISIAASFSAFARSSLFFDTASSRSSVLRAYFSLTLNNCSSVAPNFAKSASSFACAISNSL